MFMSRSQVGCLMLILLSVSAFHHGIAVARNLKDIYVEDKKKTQNGKEGGSKIKDNNGYVANVNRTIPSGPDPKHNSGSDGGVPSYSSLYKTEVEESATLPSKEKVEVDNWP